MSSKNLNIDHHCHRRDSAKMAACGIDDLLLSTEGGKHDYDWLLTPPRTRDFPASEGKSQPILAPPRSNLGRSTSNTNVSRLAASQNQCRAARSSSVSRSSIYSSQSQHNKAYSSNKSSSIPNIVKRPSSPITRRSTSATRSSTPTRPSADKTRPSLSPPSSSSSSTPTCGPSNLHSPSSPARSLSNSQPCPPNRRHSTSSPPPTTITAAMPSRPSSPGPCSRLRPPPQPVVPQGFPLETPPNLRTTLPQNRPVSAGRGRPPPLKANSETQASSRTQRHSSPIVNKGRLSGKSHVDGDKRVPLPHLPQSVSAPRKSTITSDVNNNNGFGRTTSKKSLDVAVRHMDTRKSPGSVGRSFSGAMVFPQSIRKVGNDINGRRRELSTEVDTYHHYQSSSSRLLRQQDLNNADYWLHSVDDDQRPIFDNGFDFDSLPLPEPFAFSFS